MQPGTDVPGAARPVKQGRPGIIVLIAFVVEVVTIGALANQVVTKHLVTFVAAHHDRFVGQLVRAFLTYQWRVNAQPGDRANEPLAHACLVLVVLALTALLVLAVCRGPVTFARAFFGTWMAVIVSTLVGQLVFDLISPPPYPPGFSHVAGAVFTGPDGFGFIAGAMLGLLTAIFAAIFAVATRRTVRPAAGYPPRMQRGEYGEHDWSDQTAAYPRADYPPYPPDRREPYAEPERESYRDLFGGGYYAEQVGGGSAEAGGESTQQLRTVPADEPGRDEPRDEPGNEPHGGSAPPENAGEETQQFPRPPDDEQLGQQPDRHDL